MLSQEYGEFLSAKMRLFSSIPYLSFKILQIPSAKAQFINTFLFGFWCFLWKPGRLSTSSGTRAVQTAFLTQEEKHGVSLVLPGFFSLKYLSLQFGWKSLNNIKTNLWLFDKRKKRKKKKRQHKITAKISLVSTREWSKSFKLGLCEKWGEMMTLLSPISTVCSFWKYPWAKLMLKEGSKKLHCLMQEVIHRDCPYWKRTNPEHVDMAARAAHEPVPFQSSRVTQGRSSIYQSWWQPIHRHIRTHWYT